MCEFLNCQTPNLVISLSDFLGLALSWRENYRSMSILPIIAKVIDITINNQLMNHLLQHKLLNIYQYCVPSQSDTILALTSIIGTSKSHCNNQQPTLAVYIDLTKAYDAVCHETLLKEIENGVF